MPARKRPPDARAESTLGDGLVYLGSNSPLAMRTDLEAKLLRECSACKAIDVKVVHVTLHYVGSLTRGRTYQHRCGSCNATFATESVLRAMTEVSSAVGAMALGAFTFGFASGWTWIFVSGLPLGAWLMWRTVMRIVARYKNPPVAVVRPNG